MDIPPRLRKVLMATLRDFDENETYDGALPGSPGSDISPNNLFIACYAGFEKVVGSDQAAVKLLLGEIQTYYPDLVVEFEEPATFREITQHACWAALKEQLKQLRPNWQDREAVRP